MASYVRVIPLVVLAAVSTFIVLDRAKPSGVHAGDSRPNVAGLAPVPVEKATALKANLPAAPAQVETHAARMLHEDPRHTHRAHGRGPHAKKVAWTYDAHGPIEAEVTTSPDEARLYVASLAGSLTALTREGQMAWSVALGDRIYGTPCVAESGVIYVGSDAKRFVAIDRDGHVMWKIETEGDADTSAVIDEGNVIFAAGADVFAVRPGGDLAWRFRAKKKVFTSPAITRDGLVIVGAQDHRVYAIGKGGLLAWSIDLGADVDGSAAIGDDGAIFVGTDGGEIVRIDHAAITWRTSVGGYVRGALSVARNGDVIAGTYGPAPRVVRLDGATGSPRGAFAIQGTGAREFGIHGGPLEDDDGLLFFGAQDDRAYALDADGSVLWTFETGADVDAPLTLLSDGSLVVASDDGKVTLLRP